jgi:hypothetical protein
VLSLRELNVTAMRRGSAHPSLMGAHKAIRNTFLIIDHFPTAREVKVKMKTKVVTYRTKFYPL